MVETKVTGEMAVRVWEQLEDGVLLEDTDAPSDRARQRIRTWLGRFDRGYKGGEVKGDWPRFSKELFPYYVKYRKLFQKPILPTESSPRPPRRGAYSRLLSDIGGLFDSMWVPDPDKIDLPPFDKGSGPRTNLADGRSFYWVKDGSAVVRCWLADVEEDRLGEVFDLLEQRDPQAKMRARYRNLQSEMTNIFSQIRTYRFGVYQAGELESIRGLQELILGNAHIDLKERRYAVANELIDRLPLLSGKVEEFCRDLKSVVLDLQAEP